MSPAGSGAAGAPTMPDTAQRRATRLAIAALLVLSTSAVFAHDLGGGAQAAFLRIGHLGTLCLTALGLLFEPVHYAFHAVFAAGLAYAVYDRIRAWHTLRRTLGLLDARLPTAGDGFWRAALAARVDPRRIRIVEGLPNPALTAGMLRPRIYLTRALDQELSQEELAAVLAHEGAHVARRDPLRLSALRFLACTLFWLPALRRLTDDMADETELLADDHAARGRPLILAQAILTVARRPAVGWAAVSSAGFHRGDLLERRIRRLAGEPVRAPSRLTRSAVLGALGLLALAWASGLAAAQPASAPGGTPEARCSRP